MLPIYGALKDRIERGIQKEREVGGGGGNERALSARVALHMTARSEIEEVKSIQNSV